MILIVHTETRLIFHIDSWATQQLHTGMGMSLAALMFVCVVQCVQKPNCLLHNQIQISSHTLPGSQSTDICVLVHRYAPAVIKWKCTHASPGCLLQSVGTFDTHLTTQRVCTNIGQLTLRICYLHRQLFVQTVKEIYAPSLHYCTNPLHVPPKKAVMWDVYHAWACLKRWIFTSAKQGLSGSNMVWQGTEPVVSEYQNRNWKQ